MKYRELPYYRTRVAISKTQEDIKKLLKKYNLKGIRFTDLIGGMAYVGILEFILEVDNKELSFRFSFNIPENQNLQKQVYRAVFHYLKARFTSIDFGITTVEKEFMQEIVLKLPNGLDKTMKEIAEEKGILEFTSEDLLLPSKDRR